MSSILRFTRDHEWVKVDGAAASVGISVHAVGELGDVIFVELPAVGDTVAQGGKIAVVESVKAASDVFSPVAGKVVEVNEALSDNPAMLNEDPMGEAWIAKLKIENTADLDGLMNSEQYENYLKEASH